MNKEFEFENKICVITGGSKGIGKEICRQLLTRGAIVISISSSSGITPEKIVFADKKKHYEVMCDITIQKEVKKIFKRIKDHFG
ncbi:SDR family NAD(P)-dependent oxidoreductase, partial [Enterococcus faecium]|nr:SDR family NAD(P)-dependent oxidoreductase [Enterococcus faecium]